MQAPHNAIAAAEFRAGQPQLVAQIPEQRHVRIALERLGFTIDFELNHRFTSAEMIAGAEPPSRGIVEQSTPVLA